MTVPPELAGLLLSYVAASDYRIPTPTREMVIAWSRQLREYVNLIDGQLAIDEHYATNTKTIMQADINQWVRKIRDKRIATMPPREPPAEIPGHKYSIWQSAYLHAIGDGHTATDSRRLADEACKTIQSNENKQIQ